MAFCLARTFQPNAASLDRAKPEPSGLHCVMKVPGIPVGELKTVKRYGGDIAALAWAVRQGKWPSRGSDEMAPVTFIEIPEPPHRGPSGRSVRARPGQHANLGPLRNGPSCTKALNRVCQSRFTAQRPSVQRWSPDFDQAVSRGLHLHAQPLDKGIQNCSLGSITEVAPVPPEMETNEAETAAWVTWDDGAVRPLALDMLEDIKLGFAATVHKAQGSQSRRIIVPVTDSRLLDRTLLYTAITRAQAQVILVGDFAIASRKTKAPPKAQSRKVALDVTRKRLLKAEELNSL